MQKIAYALLMLLKIHICYYINYNLKFGKVSTESNAF